MLRPPSFALALLRAFLAVCTAFGLLFFVVTLTPLDSWWAGILAGPWSDPAGDILVVPAGSLVDSAILGESSYWRSVYAVLAYRSGKFGKIFLTGGGANGPPAAKLMADFLVAHGVPRDIILLETASQSTRENALRTAAALQSVPGRKVLLTSDYHMFRAARAFRRAGLAVEPRPFPDARKRAVFWRHRWGVFLELGTETVKIGYYFVLGWL
jgi:uncharacterized SAM-binding protein YcdF (DUF218 family)